MAFDLLAPFTGAPLQTANQQQQDVLRQTLASQQAQTDAAKAQGLAALTSGATSATGAIGTGISTGRADIGAATPEALAALYGGRNQAIGAVTGAVDPAIAALQGGVQGVAGAYDPLKAAATQYGQFGTGASQAQRDALGLNGPEGVARAQTTFQAGPGFQFALGQGLDAITRAQNAAGMVASGNTTRAAQTFGQGLGQQEWQKYIDNLRQQSQLYSPLEAQALAQYGAGTGNAALTGGINAANIYGTTGKTLADLFSNTGTNVAGVETGAGKSLAELAQTGGLATANVYQDEAARQAALIDSLTKSGMLNQTKLTGDLAGSIGAQGAIGMIGPTNLWNLGISGAKALAGGGAFANLGGGGGTQGYAPTGTNFGSVYGPQTSSWINPDLRG